MKIKLLLAILIIIPQILICQKNQSKVVPGGGGKSQNGTYKNFGTFGQPFATKSSNANFKNKEGFLNSQSPSKPIVLSVSVNDVTATTANCEGNLVHKGFLNATSGFVWSDFPNPQIGINEFGKTIENVNVGNYIHSITGLEPFTLYYIRAYSMNTEGISYGTVMMFTTEKLKQNIGMNQGWNLISTYLEPDNTNMPVIWNDIKTFVNLVKNNAGQSFIPQFNINQIGNWNKYEGYQVSMNTAKTLTTTGIQIKPENTPISLTTGWKIVSYLRNSPLLAPTALASLTSQNALTICKNNIGQSFIPQFNINQIGNLLPGQGYQMFLSINATLTYPANSLSKSTSGESLTPMAQILIPEYSVTGNNSTLLVMQNAPNGNEIGVYNQNEKLIGSGIFHNGIATVTIWGDDEQTDISDGAKINEQIRIKNYDVKSGRLSEIELTDLVDIISDNPLSSLTYSKDAFVIAKVANMKNSSNISLDVLPNPASDNIEIEFKMPDCIATELKIYSIDGKLVTDLSSQLVEINSYKLSQNISNLISGEYTIILTCGNERAMRKIIKIK